MIFYFAGNLGGRNIELKIFPHKCNRLLSFFYIITDKNTEQEFLERKEITNDTRKRRIAS